MRRPALAAAAVMGALWPGAMPVEARQRAVTCEVSDYSMNLRLRLPLAFDKSGSLGEKPMRGTLEILHQKVPRERRLWSLDGMRPAQFWNRDGELKIYIVLSPREQPIELIIQTRARESETYQFGDFQLNAPEIKLSGRLACHV